MNVLYFDIYDYTIEIKSSSHALKNLKVNTDFEFFATIKNSENHLQVKISELTYFEKQGIFLWKTSKCEVRQTGLRERQLIYSSHGRTLAVVVDQSHGWSRQVDLQVQAPEAIDDVLYDLVNSCAGEFLDANGLMRAKAFESSLYNIKRHSFLPYPPRNSQAWEYLLRANNLPVLFKILKNRIRLVFAILKLKSGGSRRN